MQGGAPKTDCRPGVGGGGGSSSPNFGLLPRKCVRVPGAGLRGHHVKQLDTCMTNALARRIVSGGRKARLPVRDSVAVILTKRNLFIQKCAFTLRAALTAQGSTIQGRMRFRLAKLYGVREWGVYPRPLPSIKSIPPAAISGKFADV